ncbi:hypothetical protein pb186bvf_004149 [Paramecium bursaria]
MAQNQRKLRYPIKKLKPQSLGQLDDLGAIEQYMENISQKTTRTVQYQQNEIDYQAKLMDKLVQYSIKGVEPTQKYVQLCKDFQIDYKKLKNQPSLDEKQNYIIQCCHNVISLNLNDIMRRQGQYTEVPKQQKELDLFGWIQIKSNYKRIKRLLQYALLDLINETNNQQKIQDFFNFSVQLTKKYHHKQNENYSTAHTAQTYRTLQSTTAQEPLILDVPTQQEQEEQLNFHWNQAIESKLISVDHNFYDLNNKINKKSVDGASQQKRKLLLDKHQQGSMMTPEELKYLASTSYLISRYQDKVFIQKAINYLDSNIIDQIELNIANQIIKRYYQTVHNMRETRQKWLEKINKSKRFQIKQKSKILDKQKVQYSNTNQVKIIKKKMVEMLRELQKKKQLQQAKEKRKIQRLRQLRAQGNPLANIFVQKFKEKVLEIVMRHREHKKTNQEKQQEFLERNAAKPPEKPIFTSGIDYYDTQRSKRMFHPPSKLLTEPTPETHKDNKLVLETNKKVVKQYRLGIRNYNIPLDQFKVFYSGGPITQRQFQNYQLRTLNDDEDQNLKSNQNWITNEIEIQAANLNQASFQKPTLLLQKRKRSKRKQNKKQENILKQKTFLKDQEKNQKATNNRPNLEIQASKAKNVFQDKLSLNTEIIKSKREQFEQLSTTKRVKLEIQQLEKKKKQQKFSNQKEMSENKMKNRKLIIAAKMRNLQVAIQAGFQYVKADTKLYDQYGNTPLYYAAKNGDEVFCRFLLNLGADVNQPCSNGNTPLHMAFMAQHQQIIIDFINNKGDLNVLNDQNFTPLAFAHSKLLSQLNLKNQIVNIQSQLNRELDNNEINYQKYQVKPEMIDDYIVCDLYKNNLVK